jgi:hypothetical protein
MNKFWDKMTIQINTTYTYLYESQTNVHHRSIYFEKISAEPCTVVLLRELREAQLHVRRSLVQGLHAKCSKWTTNGEWRTQTGHILRDTIRLNTGLSGQCTV